MSSSGRMVAFTSRKQSHSDVRSRKKTFSWCEYPLQPEEDEIDPDRDIRHVILPPPPAHLQPLVAQVTTGHTASQRVAGHGCVTGALTVTVLPTQGSI